MHNLDQVNSQSQNCLHEEIFQNTNKEDNSQINLSEVFSKEKNCSEVSLQNNVIKRISNEEIVQAVSEADWDKNKLFIVGMGIALIACAVLGLGVAIGYVSYVGPFVPIAYTASRLLNFSLSFAPMMHDLSRFGSGIALGVFSSCGLLIPSILSLNLMSQYKSKYKEDFSLVLKNKIKFCDYVNASETSQNLFIERKLDDLAVGFNNFNEANNKKISREIARLKKELVV